MSCRKSEENTSCIRVKYRSSLTHKIWKIYKFIRKWEKWVEEQTEHNLDNYLSIKRLTIMSQEMPLSERISAGEKYIKYGGNGEVKHKYEELLTFLPTENNINNG